MAANQKNAENSDRFYGRIRAATLDLARLEAEIQSIQTAYSALPVARQNAITSNLVARGHTGAEIDAYYQQLIAIKAQITAIVTQRFEATEI